VVSVASNLPQQLRPRVIEYEPTSAQIRGELYRQMRLVLEAQLRTFYAPRKPVREESYGGDMNKDVEDSDAVYGCEIEPDFADWMQTHRLTDHEEARRLYQVEKAMSSLLAVHPYWYHVVSTRSRSGHALSYLAGLWQHGDRRVNTAYSSGLRFLLEQLNPAEVAEMEEIEDME
jgi:hypothetical protein